MDKQVLVAYATKYGATAEIAGKIGRVLRQAGLPTDVLSVEHVSDLTPYTAVVLGSAVYVGKWRKEAVQFLEDNEELLADRQAWLFSSGPTGTGDPVEIMNGWRFPEALLPFADTIRPRDVAVFHGDLNVKKLNFLEKWVINNVKSPIGDFRDWDAITTWATTIANELKEMVFSEPQ